MAETANVFTLRRKARHKEDGEVISLKEGLSRTRQLIHQAYANFNGTHDPDLIESYVFEINALQARYSYLLRRVKELESPELEGG